MVKISFSACKDTNYSLAACSFYVSFSFFYVSLSHRGLFSDADKRKVAADIHIRATTVISFTITNSFYKN